jgi:alpha-1,2-mannosyltransferase
MSTQRWLDVGPRRVAWRLFQLITLAAFGYSAWRLLGHSPYRIDIDVYRMGGRAWLDGHPLYTADASFHTRAGADLPFTYPPLAAIVFAPFAWLSLPAAGTAITTATLLLLVVSTALLLTGLDVWPDGPGWAAVTREPVWARRCWLAAAIVAPAVIWLEPIRSNFDFGQINVVLMTLVIADCLPRRTPWPRGMLLGWAIALKLTPAVFLLYFVLRRDRRAVLTALASFVGATLLGCVLAWRDSLEYWTTTVRDTDRIGTATLNTNQNIAAGLARLGLGGATHFVLWASACLVVLALTVWAVRRVLTACTGPQSALALICVALFGLVVSPVSWSHHWVWALPTLVVGAVLGYRHRDLVLAATTAAGLALLMWTPMDLMTEHHETDASWWRQLAGGSYIWWALAVILAAGLTASRPHDVSRLRSAESGRAARPAEPKPALHRL